MRRLRQPTGNVWIDISKSNDMHFVYAFFFENGDKVHVKVGQSTKPYRRLSDIVCGCPFQVSQAVFCHAGSKSEARTFEERVKLRLSDRRTRGEWYVFDRDDGKEFSSIIKVVFAESTGRKLKWTPIDLEKFYREQAEAAKQFHNRKMHGVDTAN